MVKTLGIIGAGQMGSGIAHTAILAGFDVYLSDVSLEAATDGVDTVRKGLESKVGKGKLTSGDMKAALDRLKPVAKLSDLTVCDLIIEAATENEAVKTAIFKELCQGLPEKTLIASNTSSISITRLAASTDRPDRFMGVHFMNPVPVMQLVELIRGIATSDETFQTLSAFATKMGKTTAVSEDFPAFIVNRILIPMINEAIYTLYEGVGNVKAIDTAMQLGANHPMGPLTLADFIGLDTCLSIMQVLYDGLADSKYRPCPLLVKYVEAGWLGRKAGRGFYDYSGSEPVPTR